MWTDAALDEGLRIEQSQFSRNTAQAGGGAVRIVSGQHRIANTEFRNNETVTEHGGAVFVTGPSQVDLIQAAVWNNTAGERAGGLYASGVDATVNIINSTFAANTGRDSKAALSLATDFDNVTALFWCNGRACVNWCPAGAGAYGNNTTLIARNSIFSGNVAEGTLPVRVPPTLGFADPAYVSGGGFDDLDDQIFAVDETVEFCADGEQIYSDSVTLIPPFFLDFLPKFDFVSTSCLQDLSTYNDNGNADTGDTSDPGAASPTFVSLQAGDLRLLSGSTCIDSGSQFVDFDSLMIGFQFAPETDIDGLPRIVDGNSDGEAIIDMGAHEYQGQ